MSILFFDSSKNLLTTCPKIKTCFSTSLLFQGDSALVNLKFMFIALHILVKWSFANSSQSSLRNFSGKRYTRTHNWNILLMISAFLDAITADVKDELHCLSYVTICVFCKVLNLLQRIQGILML